MRKILTILWNAGATIFWGMALILVPIVLLWNITDDWCGTEQYEVFLSPNNDIEAVVNVINCGATTNYETQISVNRINTPEDKDVLVVLDGHPNELVYKVTWLSENTLEVSEFNFQDLLRFHSRNTVGDIVTSQIRPGVR
ncbi:hypothetical protein [Thalassotalea sediminis]|uniref:hypothetical protein n=1 Tax=Thalassotalea sediminis TaxID=1759089 RepID=UPI00257411E9|nr:hypothetical protein [Thalassotalea sediminis]